MSRAGKAIPGVGGVQVGEGRPEALSQRLVAHAVVSDPSVHHPPSAECPSPGEIQGEPWLLPLREHSRMGGHARAEGSKTTACAATIGSLLWSFLVRLVLALCCCCCCCCCCLLLLLLLLLLL